MTRGPRQLLIALLLIDLAFLLVLVGVQQIRVAVVTSGSGEVVLDDGVRRVLPDVVAPSLMQVTFENSGDGGVLVSALRTGHGAVLFDERTYAVTGDFAPVGTLRAGGPWSSNETGSTLTWTGRVAGLSATLTCAPGSGAVCATASGLEKKCWSLGDCASSIAAEFPSAHRIHHGLVPLWRGSFIIDLAPTLQLQSVKQWFGLQPLEQRESPARKLEYEIPFGTRLKALLGLVANAAALLLRALLMVLLLSLVGSVLVTPILERLGLLEALLLSFFAGEALTSNFITALFHVVRVQLATAAIVVPLLVIAAVQLSLGGARRWRECVRRGWLSEHKELAMLGLLALISTTMMFFPALPFPGWFTGHGYTDSVDYPGWASVAHDASLDRSLGAVRYQDYVRVAVTSLLSGVNTTSALSLEPVRLWLIWPFLTFALLRRLGLAAPSALFAAAIAAHATAFFEIFTQGYLPHFEVVHFAVAGLWAVGRFIEQPAEGSAAWWERAALAAVFACSVGLYPYQAFSVMGFGLIWGLIAVLGRDRRALVDLVAVAVLVAAFANVNLEIVFDFGQGSMQHRQALNAIGRNIVFPWYAQPEARAILSGTDDFARNSVHSSGFAGELFASMPLGFRGFQAIDRVLAELVPFAACASILAALGSVLWLMTLRTRAGWVAAATLCLPIALTVSLVLRDDVYFWVKSLMTLAALVVAPMAGLLAVLASGRRPVLVLSAAVTLGFAVTTLRALWFDHVGYFVNRESVWLTRTHTHLPVHNESLWRLQRFVEELPPGQRFVLLERMHDRFFTDGDIVTYNKVLTLLQGHSVRYGSSETRRYTRTREVEFSGAAPLTDFDWAVQFDRCAELPVPSAIALETDTFCVRRLNQR